MIIALTIREEIKKPWYKRIFVRKKNDIEAVIREYKEMKVLDIQAKNIGGKVNFKKISKLIPKGSHILYNGDINIPEKYEIHVANPTLYKFCLLRNTYRYILKQTKIDPKILNVGLYDPSGNYVNLVKEIIPFVRQINVVTNNQEKYVEEANYIMNEFGAAVLISNSTEWLSNSHIILAPEKIVKYIPSSVNTMILTAYKPAISLKGIVYYGYKVKLPKFYQKIKPAGISEELFIGALYEEYRIKDLEKMVPCKLETYVGNYDIEKVICYLENVCR